MIRNPFSHLPIQTHRARALSQAERDLLEAEHNAEHWIAHRDMLARRVERLKESLIPGEKDLKNDSQFQLHLGLSD